ncbi:MAG: hypothetical protein KDK25_03465, partial [Leptospiraceae bacterium]|nr:hypothetical protein [Leptospiraceae bacterium]
ESRVSFIAHPGSFLHCSSGQFPSLLIRAVSCIAPPGTVCGNGGNALFPSPGEAATIACI